MTIKLNGHRIYPSPTIKYLGFQLDETLSGAAHCSELAKKLIRANAMLTKVRHYVSEDKLISIYFAIFSSHMTYGCQVWGQNHSSKNRKRPPLRMNSKALRLIKKKHNAYKRWLHTHDGKNYEKYKG